MGEYILKKKYLNHFGVDYKSTDITRDERYASDLLNVQYRKSGAIEKRKGYQIHSSSVGGMGLFNYNRVDPSTNLESPQIIAVDSSVWKSNVNQFTVSYSGVDPTCYMSLFVDPDTSTYKAQIIEGSTLILDEDLGLGFDEATPVTLSDLKTAIDALSGFSATITGATTTPAAFLTIVRDYNLSSTGSDLVLTARYWTEVNKTVTSPLSAAFAARNSASFENVSGMQLNNVLYLSSGYDAVLKYDGQTVYKAGLPTPASISTALGGAGAITGSNYAHKARYIQYDAVSNLTEANLLQSSTTLNPAAQSINVTVANIQAGSGYNTNCAIVAGAQVAVNTITVDDGSGGSHTMKVGDTAYFFDSVSSSYVERSVSAVAATTITVSGAAVTVADNAVISNNLRIGIYRNETSATPPTLFFTVAEIPNNSFASTQVFNDNLADASLGAILVEPIFDRSPPPVCRYITSFKNQAILLGDPENPNTFYWSDIDSPEYWPIATNSADVNTASGDIISGGASNNEVFTIFKKKSIHVLSGDLPNFNIRIDLVTSDIGCAAHASIQDIRGTLFFLSQLGPRQMRGGQLPTPLGASVGDPNASRIDPLFDQGRVASEEQLKVQKALSVNYRFGEKYICFVPCETNEGGSLYANENSRLFVYDHTRDAWLIWDSINCAGGIIEYDDILYWVSRRYSEYASAVKNEFSKQHNLSDSYDYADNVNGIEWIYKSHWETLSEPSVLKRWIANRVFALEKLENNALMLRVTTEANFIPDVIINDYTIDFSDIGYGSSAYGSASYGDPAVVARFHKLNKGRFLSFRVNYLNDAIHENVIITGWEMQIAAPYLREFKS